MTLTPLVLEIGRAGAAGDELRLPFDWAVEHVSDGRIDGVWNVCAHPRQIVFVAAHGPVGFYGVVEALAGVVASCLRFMDREVARVAATGIDALRRYGYGGKRDGAHGGLLAAGLATALCHVELPLRATFIESLLLAAAYRDVARLCHAADALSTAWSLASPESYDPVVCDGLRARLRAPTLDEINAAVARSAGVVIDTA